MRSASGDETGSITAEFAAVVPAVLLVLAMSLAALQLGSAQLRLQDAAAVTARALARGDSAPGVDAAVATWRQGDLLCVRLSRAAQFAVTLSAESCALA